ncbi:myb-like protein Q [Drosophila obscura]|uniref:myb-like protein Q n=1 Tax=Drosophila obscura TaxID=7282 RepID=UPI001BB21234|nr:myb-like protein Q [Drosophila obscura]
MSRSQKSVDSQQKQQQQQQQKAPQIPPNGLLIYGNGLVFGGNVYPVLVDGVPMQAPVGAQQAAAQQRWQMMHGPAMAQQPVNAPGQKQQQHQTQNQNQHQNREQRPRHRQQLQKQQQQQQYQTGPGTMSPRHPQSFRPKTRTRLQSQPPRNSSIPGGYPPQCPASSSAPNIAARNNRGYGMQMQQQQQYQQQHQQQHQLQLQQQQQQIQQQQQQHQLQSAMGVHYNYGYMTNGSDIGGWNGYVNMLPPTDANKPYSFD